MSEESKRSSRWWEFYFVRYFVGTVVGLAIVIFLLFQSQSPFSGSKFLGDVTVMDLTAANVLLLSGIGLAFCYISSAPILVFHALRSAFEYPENKRPRPVIGPIAVVLASVAIIMVAVAKFSGTDLFQMLGWVFVCVVVLVQVFLYWRVFHGGAAADFFYDRLSLCRARAGKSDEEYVESYRHLREHGNAFLILIFEAGLGASMYLMDTRGQALAVVFLWVAPAAFVWFLGTYLEYRFIQRGPRQTDI